MLRIETPMGIFIGTLIDQDAATVTLSTAVGIVPIARRTISATRALAA